jgi:hypothetical protein
MDMKKILQAFDGASSKKPAEGSNDMKKFMKIVEGKGPLNRLTQAESITQQQYTAPEPRKTITSPVLNVAKNAKPSMIGKYFKSVEQEFTESEKRYKDRARRLAERVIERVIPGQETPPGINRLTGKPIQPAAPAASAPQAPQGYSKEYLQKAADPNRFGRYLISIEKAQELLTQMDQQGVQEETEGVDSITLDVPLFIRLMEFAREDAEDDMVLHKIAERLVGMAEEGQSLSMSDYEEIVGQVSEAHGNSKIYDKCWTGYKKVPGKKRGEDGSCKKK